MRQIQKKPLPERLENMLISKVENGKRYKHLTPAQKRHIKEQLLQSQKYLCCYCEKSIDMDSSHIEHFFEQGQEDGRDRTLDYMGNLLASCLKTPYPKKEKETQEEKGERLDEITCGHRKTGVFHDSTLVDYDLLINPMTEDTTLLAYLSDGGIESVTGSDEAAKYRVAYTVNRLRLSGKKLIQSRIAAIEGLVIMLQELPSQQEQALFVLSVLDEAQDKLPPHYSCLKNNFSYIVSLSS